MTKYIAASLLTGTLMIAETVAFCTAGVVEKPQITAAATSRETCIIECEARRDACLDAGGAYSTCVSAFMSCKRRCEATWPASTVSAHQQPPSSTAADQNALRTAPASIVQ